MANLILPTIGTSGTFELMSPLDVLIVNNERYTCKALRNLSDYIANNEDPKVDIYDLYNIPAIEYEQDLTADMVIVSLQSDKGHWLHIPGRYFVTFPLVNGIPYRSSMIGISLPALPANIDLSGIETDIRNMITERLGVNCVIKTVETSKISLIDKATHDIEQAARNAIATNKSTDRSRYTSLLNIYNDLVIKVHALEQYIEVNHI